MFTLLTIIHIIISILLIVIVLLQAGKGAGMGAAFGGSSQTVFGATGGSFLGKMTATFAVIFMLTSIGLAYLSSSTGSVVDSIIENVEDDKGAVESSVKTDDTAKKDVAAKAEVADKVKKTGDDSAKGTEGKAVEGVVKKDAAATVKKAVEKAADKKTE